jgi:hypothetical protein
VASCPGSLIVHYDGTIDGCTEDDEAGGCRGRDARHEGDSIRRTIWNLSGCSYCGGVAIG